MATLTKEQIEQKLQQLKQLTEEVNALTKELAEAGAIKLSDEDLAKVDGGISKKIGDSTAQKTGGGVGVTGSQPDFSRSPFNPIN